MSDKAARQLLVTRPFPGGQKTASRLAELGHKPIACPLFSKKILPFTPLSPQNMVATIFTSPNAVTAIQSDELEIGHKLLPCFTVGDTTAQTAQNHGFHNVINAKGNAQDLIALIKKMGLGGIYFYPCAKDRKPDIEQAFADNEIQIAATPIYEMVAAVNLPQPVINRLQENDIDAVVIYSQRAATHFIALCAAANIDIEQQKFICLSPSIWEILTHAGAKNGLVANKPNENALFAQIDNLPDSNWA